MNVMTPIVRDPSQQKFDTTDHLAHAAQQAEDRRYEDFMIIDVDSHHYETGSFKDIIHYIEDPVMRDQFKYTKGQTLMLRSTGGFQEMAGRIARYEYRNSEQIVPGGRHKDITLDAQVDGRHGRRRRLPVSHADAGPRPQSHRRGRGAVRARL